ncbi:T9SS type A sorting domain-containing protein [Flavobacterium psychrotrophum]|uniref:T9SS type A sorting domain-containing protein n=1 Tax=Flavobacterium psychrotrophum TaxID=2294119 RepID=UPI000E316593|nr:T9SS type A sorting domain-containing protein [Flavobacterium psychrotrophum]
MITFAPQITNQIIMRSLSPLLLFIYLFFFNSVFAQEPPVFSWAYTAEIPMHVFKDVKTDSQGNVYAIGSFLRNFTLGGVTFNTVGYAHVVVTKFNRDGNLVWVKQLFDPESSVSDMDYGYAITIDASDNIYVAGSYTGTVSLAGVEYTSAGVTPLRNLYVAKLNQAGEVIWSSNAIATGASGLGFVSCTGLNVDSSGNLYITGDYTTNLSFGSTVLTTSSSYTTSSMFLAKYDASGNFAWAKSGPGVSGGVVTDVAGNVYVGGGNIAGRSFGPFALPDAGCGFLAKFSGDGEGIWINKNFSWGPEFKDIDIDRDGNVIAIGTFTDYLTVDGQTYDVPNTSFNYNFVIKYNTEGVSDWVKTFGGATSDKASLVIDSHNNIYISGFYSGLPLRIDGFELPRSETGFKQSFFTKLTSDGGVSWLRGLNTMDSGYELSAGIDLDSAGNIFVVGNAYAETNFDSLGTTAGGAFVGKLGDYQLGLDDIRKNHINLYPIPVKDYLSIESGAEIKQINIYSTLGKLIYSNVINTGSSAKLNIAELPAGYYILQIIGDNTSYCKKILKN